MGRRAGKMVDRVKGDRPSQEEEVRRPQPPSMALTLSAGKKGDEATFSIQGGELTALEEEDRHLAQVEINEVLCLVRDIGPKVSTDYAMPGRVILLVELLLYVRGNVLVISRNIPPRRRTGKERSRKPVRECALASTHLSHPSSLCNGAEEGIGEMQRRGGKGCGEFAEQREN